MTDHADLLRRAATKARETAQAAPRGPYTVDTKRTPDDTRILFADDGDAFAVATDWAGGHGYDTGTPEQTGAHIALWHPGVAHHVASMLACAASVPERDRDGIAQGRCGNCGTSHLTNIAQALLNEPEEA